MLEIVVILLLIYLFLYIICKLTLGRCTSPVCLIGKTVLITGGNTGVGFQTALALAGRGCRLIIADKDDCTLSRQKIIEETGNTNIVIKQFDLASLTSIRKLAKDINETEDSLDVLINNAGVLGTGHAYTKDGLHMGMQVNHFGPFLLTHLLVGLLKKSAPSRIIFVSSISAYLTNLNLNNLNFPKSDSTNIVSELYFYGNSKLCAIITARGFAKKLKGTGVTSNSLHPGIVHTPIYTKLSSTLGNTKFQKRLILYLMHKVLLLRSAEEGAQTTIHLAIAKEVKEVTGRYFMECKPFRTPSPAKNEDFSSKIWKASEDYVKLTPEEIL